MPIQLAQPLAFSFIGQRTVNQDTIYPTANRLNPNTRLFVVCDGMGGADKGEVASQLVCQAMAEHIAPADALTPELLDDALDAAHRQLQTYRQQHVLVSRMGCTLALLHIHESGVTAAHIGDSRIYQVRAGKILFQTQDHRQVADMVEAGIITATQALTHPWRNRLSRAVVVTAEPSTQRSRPDVCVLTDVQPGDYFFMCTDGVQENLDNPTLETLLAGTQPDAEKLDTLLSLCAHRTKDNYSGFLIHTV